MENTMNENYGTENRNSQYENTTTGLEKINDNLEKLNHDHTIDNDPESFYSNDKNADPQKSEYTTEAELSNEDEEESDDAEDINDFEDIDLDAARPDFQEVEKDGVLEIDDQRDVEY